MWQPLSNLHKVSLILQNLCVRNTVGLCLLTITLFTLACAQPNDGQNSPGPSTDDSSDVSTQIVIQTVTPPANPQPTNTGTAVPPTNTAVSTATATQVVSTSTPLPTASPTPLPPTNTPTATATSTPLPTASPTPLPPTNTPTATATSTPVPPTNTPAPTATPVSYEFRGTGDDLTGEFELAQGIVILTAAHSGQSNFIVEIISTDTGDTELSINEIGSYSGDRAHQVSSNALFGMRPGQHRISVDADGDWTIGLLQPTWADGQLPPVQWSGSGDDVVGPIRLPAGLRGANFTHNGQSNFIVELMTVDGSSSELMVNEIGEYEGTVAVNVQENSFFGLEPDIYLLVIEADGSWTAEFE